MILLGGFSIRAYDPDQLEAIRDLLTRQRGLEFELVTFDSRDAASAWLDAARAADRKLFGARAPVMVLSAFHSLTQEERRRIDADRGLDKAEIFQPGGAGEMPFVQAIADLIGRTAP